MAEFNRVSELQEMERSLRFWFVAIWLFQVLLILLAWVHRAIIWLGWDWRFLTAPEVVLILLLVVTFATIGFAGFKVHRYLALLDEVRDLLPDGDKPTSVWEFALVRLFDSRWPIPMFLVLSGLPSFLLIAVSLTYAADVDLSSSNAWIIIVGIVGFYVLPLLAMLRLSIDVSLKLTLTITLSIAVTLFLTINITAGPEQCVCVTPISTLTATLTATPTVDGVPTTSTRTPTGTLTPPTATGTPQTPTATATDTPRPVAPTNTPRPVAPTDTPKPSPTPCHKGGGAAEPPDTPLPVWTPCTGGRG